MNKALFFLTVFVYCCVISVVVSLDVHHASALYMIPLGSLPNVEMLSDMVLPKNTVGQIGEGSQVISRCQEDESQAAEAIPEAAEQQNLKNPRMEADNHEPVSHRTIDPVLVDMDKTNEDQVNHHIDWQVPAGARAYQSIKTLEIDPPNLRVWVRRTKKELPRDVLQNVLQSMAVRKFGAPAEPLESDTDPAEERSELTDAEGESVKFPQDNAIVQETPDSSNFSSKIAQMFRMNERFDPPAVQQPAAGPMQYLPPSLKGLMGPPAPPGQMPPPPMQPAAAAAAAPPVPPAGAPPTAQPAASGRAPTGSGMVLTSWLLIVGMMLLSN